MANTGDHRALRGDRMPPLARRGGPLPARPLHDVGAGGDGTPLAGRAPPGRGSAVLGDQQADARVDDDRDARGALAAVRGRWVPARARPAETPESDRLTIAVPAKGRLREPSISLLD